MFQNHIGEFSALAVAFFWTITALAIESASLKVGSIVVNVIRMFLGFLFISIFTWIKRGLFFPTDASLWNWQWLLCSGLVGFFLGDLFLFKSYTLISSRFSMLIMCFAPPISAFLGWIFLNEKMTSFKLLGMAITFLGIFMAIFSRNDKKQGLKLKLKPLGVLFAFGGALGQAGGLILSKKGMQGYDAFASTQIRLIAGFFGFLILVTVLKRWGKVFHSIKNLNGMGGITIGSFFGPFLGVSFSLLSLQYIQVGIASTIMSLVPVLIILPSALIFKQKVTVYEVIGAFISICGVAMFFVK